MYKTFAIGRLVIGLSFSKSFLFCKGNDTYLFHAGIWRKDEMSAIKIVFLPISIMIGWA